jgi:hypothetical protein
LSLTYGFIGNQRLVIEAENLCHVVKIWMLHNKTPKRVVHPVVEVCNGNLHTPVVLIVELHMPVHSDRAHVVRALQQRTIVFLRSVYPLHLKNFGVAPACVEETNMSN